MRGFSLVEMLAATALMAGTVAPALAVMRDAMAISRESTRRQLLSLYAVQALENHTALTMQNWANGSASMSAALDGQPNIRMQIIKSDAVVDGGLPNRLMHLRVVAFDDADADSTLDASELAVRVRTKVAKLTSYENEPN